MKKRINMIIGKKQIIITGLVLILGVAVYINFLIGSNLSTDQAVNGELPSGNYGDLQFVSGNDENKQNEEEPKATLSFSGSEDNVTKTVSGDTQDSEAYFAQARLDKEESRAKALEALQSMYLGGDSTDTEMAVMAENAAQLSGYIESESKIENVLKAQGFEDVLCYLSDNKASIIVKTSGLDAAEAAQIKSALLSEVEVANENITIVEVN